MVFQKPSNLVRRQKIAGSHIIWTRDGPSLRINMHIKKLIPVCSNGMITWPMKYIDL